MFITIEDETGIANLVVWAKKCEEARRTILSAGMISVRGRVQREGEVVHIVAHQIGDLSAELASIGERGTVFPLPHGRGDEFHNGSPTPDPRGPKAVPAARYLHPRPAHRHDEGEAAGLSVTSPSGERTFGDDSRIVASGAVPRLSGSGNAQR
jgi:error-prone DNA polymerase